MKRLLAAGVIVFLAAQSGEAARRRGSKIYPDKETTADMAAKNRIFIGWVDFREDDWAAHGYSSKSDWANAVVALNSELQRICQAKYLAGKTVVGAKGRDDQGPSDSELKIRFSDVLIDYNNYHLYVSIHFIDPSSNNEIGSIPTRSYFGNDWGLVNYLKSALDEVGQKIRVEIAGGTPQEKHKRKIPLIRR